LLADRIDVRDWSITDGTRYQRPHPPRLVCITCSEHTCYW
jgi:hypothetical protein